MRPTMMERPNRPKKEKTPLEAFRHSLPARERHETNGYAGIFWDVVKARFLSRQPGRKLHTLLVRNAVITYGIDRPESLVRATRVIDHDRAMSEEIDTTIPVIVTLAPGEAGEADILVFIDGKQRLYKAYQEQRETIPCYILTREEEQACRIKTPMRKRRNS